MNKVLGIIAEYNPLHNGHLYQLNETKKIFDPDCTVCILNGNFTERGNVSLVNKWSKTEMALKSGIDLVIELPTIYGISSAENFACGAIKILNSLKCDTALSFGSECGNITTLQDFAEVLINEPSEYKTILSHELSKRFIFSKS